MDIIGTPGNDVLSGTAGDDVISGLGGDDFIDAGSAGIDTLHGNDGNDRLTAHVGTANLYGDDGDDLLQLLAPDYSGIGALADGGSGFDTLELSFPTTASASFQNGVWTYSVANIDLHRGYRHANLVGIERLVLDSDSNIVDFSGVTDGWTIEVGGSSRITTGSGNDTIVGSDGDDSISPGGGVNNVAAGGGSDSIALADGGGGAIVGGDGIDTLYAGFSVNLATGNAGAYTFSGIENVTVKGASSPVTVVGTDAANELTIAYSTDIGVTFMGGGGNDRLTSSSGNDVLDGGDGSDAVDAAEGDDRLDGGAGDDVLNGAQGDDRVDGGAGNDSIGADAGNDVINGGVGIDTLYYSSQTSPYVYPAYRLDFDISMDNQVHIVDTAGSFGSDTVTQVEYIEFRDGTLTFDADGGAALLTRLYDAAFDRAPDTAGLFAWSDSLDGGNSPAVVAASFVGSGEFADGRTLSNGGFVDLLYANALDRAPTMQERDGWIAALDGGTSRGDVLLAVSQSDEHRRDTAAAIAQGTFLTGASDRLLVQLYDTLADRKPDRPGFDSWNEFLLASPPGSTTLARVADGFALSDEFGRVTGSMTNTQFVTYLYHNSFGRDPEAGGLATWTGLLDSGGSRSQVLLGIATSPEHQIDLANGYANGITFG